MTMIYPLEESTLFFMTWFLIGLKLKNYARLAGQTAPRFCLSLTCPEVGLHISITPLVYSVATPSHTQVLLTVCKGF